MTESHIRRLGLPLLAVGIALAVAGCARSISEFTQVSSSDPIVLSRGPQAVPVATESDDDLVLKPAVVVEESTVVTPPEPTPNAVARGEYPNINERPEEPQGKLLSPEEKARVIAELEALARNQGKPGAKKPPAKKADPCETAEGAAAPDCKPAE